MGLSRSGRRRSAGRLWLFPLFVISGCLCECARAEDTVYVASPSNPQSPAKITGPIRDYNGRELVLVTGGVEKRYPAAQIADVESDWAPTHLAADELFAHHEYAEALSKYEETMRAEPRRWVQRRIVAQMIWCLRNLDQYRRAGELFLALSRDDPAMLYFSCIPLRWQPAQPAADLDKKSQEWLASDLPVATLIGASHLLMTDDRAALIKRLERVATNKDPRIASLASALVWNASFASASAKQLAAWEDEIDQFPESIRAGPYFASARALAHHQQPEEAALNLLRVPILYPEDRALAAAALLEAGRACPGWQCRRSHPGVSRAARRLPAVAARRRSARAPGRARVEIGAAS